jgi:hypothetical protein
MGAAILNPAVWSGMAAAILGAALACPPASAASSTIAISPDFNGKRAPGGIVLWFNSVVRVKGMGPSQPVTVCVTNQVVSWRDGNNVVSARVPDALVSFKPWESLSWTRFGGGHWDTSAPWSQSRADTFMSGVAIPLPGTVPPNARNVTWTAQFGADAPISLQWRAGVATYTRFGNDYDALAVVPVDRVTTVGGVRSVDFAGTPVALKPFVLAAPGDVSNGTAFTGHRSDMATVVLLKGGCGGAY